jgi:hypothetical protein
MTGEKQNASGSLPLQSDGPDALSFIVLLFYRNMARTPTSTK